MEASARHFHLTEEDFHWLFGNGKEALRYGLHDAVDRVSDQYAPAMHMDIDESNAAGFPANSDDVFGLVNL